MTRRLILVLGAALLIAACSGEDDTAEVVTTTTQPPPATTTTLEPLPPLALTSPSFEEGQEIATRFTCDGQDVNPPLEIVGLPDETVTLVLIMDDPDAPVGTWDHWVEYDIDASRGSYTMEVDAGQVGIQGVNSWNLQGYGGPCPPPGENHRYFFKIFVLNDRLGLPPGIDSEGVTTAMEGKVIAEVQLMGTYGR